MRWLVRGRTLCASVCLIQLSVWVFWCGRCESQTLITASGSQCLFSCGSDEPSCSVASCVLFGRVELQSARLSSDAKPAACRACVLRLGAGGDLVSWKLGLDRRWVWTGLGARVFSHIFCHTRAPRPVSWNRNSVPSALSSSACDKNTYHLHLHWSTRQRTLVLHYFRVSSVWQLSSAPPSFGAVHINVQVCNNHVLLSHKPFASRETPTAPHRQTLAKSTKNVRQQMSNKNSGIWLNLENYKCQSSANTPCPSCHQELCMSHKHIHYFLRHHTAVLLELSKTKNSVLGQEKLRCSTGTRTCWDEFDKNFELASHQQDEVRQHL